MFETTAVEARSRKRSTVATLMLPVSVAIHALAFSGALFFSVWNVEMPEDAPKQLRALVFTPDVPIPSGGGGAPPQPKPQVAEAARSDTPRVDATTDPIEVERAEAIADPALTSSTEIGQGDAIGSNPSGGGTGSGTETGTGTGDGPGVGNGVVEAVSINTGPLVPGGDVKFPQITLRPDPRYPDALRAMRMKGFAVVECIIGLDGKPRAIEVRNTNHALFGASAIEAVSKWRFRPGTLNGRAVETILVLKVDFQLR